MTCRIDRIGIERGVVLRVSGRVTGDDLEILHTALEESRVVAIDLLEIELVGRDAVMFLAAPQNAAAYECYLRANELARTFGGLARARDLYERSLELDPRFAPAWAHPVAATASSAREDHGCGWHHLSRNHPCFPHHY